MRRMDAKLAYTRGDNNALFPTIVILSFFNKRRRSAGNYSVPGGLEAA